MQNINRRYDIDWLRVIAIFLLLIYHIAIAFQPWGFWIRFIQNKDSLQALWVPMAMLNVWRIPLLFFVSGIGVAFAIRKRTWIGLMHERVQRILLPFVFGTLFIVPLHIFIWQGYYDQPMQYELTPAHLWFLGNIFIYVLVLSPVFFYLKNNTKSRLSSLIRKIFSTPLVFAIVALAFLSETLIVQPEAYEMYAMNFHGFWIGLLSFFFGYCFVLSGDGFWNMVVKWRWVLLAVAISSYFVRLLVFQLTAPITLKAVESSLWVFVVFGFAYRNLNKPSKVLSYLNQAVYPVYILHMFFLYIISYLVFPYDFSAEVKFIVVVLGTGFGCFLTYEFLIRRVNILKLLFGLKTESKSSDTSVLLNDTPKVTFPN